jgi:hypothetical protein
MTTAHKRFQAIQDECRKQGRPTHGREFLNEAERINEALRGKGTEAYYGVLGIIRKSREYINTTRP